MSNRFVGVFTALATPFKECGEVDYDAYKRLIKFQLENAINGLVPCGTTGEGPTLSHAEHMRLVRICVELSDGKVPVIAGVGSNNTKKVCDLSQEVEQLGVDGVLVIAPYYNKPSSDGIVEHFRSINNSINIPIVVYNHPGRTGLDIDVDILKKLSTFKNIIGIKEVSGDISRPQDISSIVGSEFVQLSGDDTTQLAFYANGGHGIISVASNIIPKVMVDIYRYASSNDFAAAYKIYREHYNLFKFLCCETNPVPVKSYMGKLGMCSPAVRLPLVGLRDENLLLLDQLLSHSELV